MRVYLDTAPIIYFVERVEGFYSSVERRLTQQDVVLVVSDLSRLECRVRPLREANVALLMDYDLFFQHAVGQVVGLTTEVLDRATEIRAHHGVRTPDAIHLAAALAASCDLFLTNDHTLQRFPDLPVEVLTPE